jgi:hypothetical protein
MLRALVVAVAFGVLSQSATAQSTLSSTCYWERLVLKARTAAGVATYGEAWDEGTESFIPFGDQDTDDTGVVLIQPDNGPAGTQIGPITVHAEAGNEDTYGEVESTGSIVYNPPELAITEAALITLQNLEYSALWGDWVTIDFGHSFLMEAQHKLASGSEPAGTWKPCVFKCLIDWLRSGQASFFLDCDWVIVGFPGQPVISGFLNEVVITYWDSTVEDYVEVYASGTYELGGIYVDIPGWLRVGDEVSWLSPSGTSLVNWGYVWEHSGPGPFVAAAIVTAMLQLEVHDDE